MIEVGNVDELVEKKPENFITTKIIGHLPLRQVDGKR